jgi:hypothetical protein
MNLAQVLHQRWAAAAALNALLPAPRVFTGISPDPSRPFATISKLGSRPLESYNDGSAVDVIGVRFQVFCDGYDPAAAVVEQIKATFDRSRFPLAGSDKVLLMRRTNDSEQQQDDGVWQMSVDFECTVYLESA